MARLSNEFPRPRGSFHFGACHIFNFRIYLSSYGVLGEYAKTRPANLADFVQTEGKRRKANSLPVGYAESRRLFADSSA